jgi:16S rRNA G1207 methylase RsmC
MDSRFNALLDHDDYDVKIGRMTIRVNRGVFAPDPALTYSTGIILDHLPEVGGKRVADIGCGSGVISIACALAGASSVIGADNDQRALNNAWDNLITHNTCETVELRLSDLFATIPESFDYIFGNLRILDELWGVRTEDAVTHAMRFVRQAKRRLNPGGSIYMPWASFGDIERLKDSFAVHNIRVREIRENRHGYTWYLFRIQ